MKKKIAIIYSGGKYWGGIETYLENLFKYYDKNKFELVLLSLGEWEVTKRLSQKSKIENQNDKSKIKIFSKKRVRTKTIAEIVDYVQKENISLIVTMGIVSNFYGRLAAKKSGTPNLTVVHSDMDLDYPGLYKRLPFKFSDKILRSVTKKYITVSKYLKEKLIELGIPGKKIEVIYNGVVPDSHAEFISASQEIPKQFRDDEIVVGSIGRLHKVKRFENLVKAMQFLPQKIKLVIYGEGKERQNLERLVQELKLDDRVSLLGFLDSEKALPDVDIYIQPSLSEGFGLTVVEAMLLEKPIIVSPYGALPELIENGKTGLVAKSTNPKDIVAAINRLIDDAELRDRLGNAAKDFAQKEFDVKKWAEKVTEVFLEVASAEGRYKK